MASRRDLNDVAVLGNELREIESLNLAFNLLDNIGPLPRLKTLTRCLRDSS
jgi:hypothetical protein